jgi:HB1, ASXL, restriction endonuclease HTH domain
MAAKKTTTSKTPKEPAAEGQKVKPGKAERPKPAKAAKEPKPKKASALDAAARVLGETGLPMTSQELIATMAAKDYWTSPKGRTPQATLYSSILREINVKGADSRFQKTDRGKFALRVQA